MSEDQAKYDAKPEPLPETKGEFWKEAETEKITLGPSLTCERTGHEFIRIGRNAKCKKCPMGYILSGPEEIKDGHIFIKAQLLI